MLDNTCHRYNHTEGCYGLIGPSALGLDQVAHLSPTICGGIEDHASGTVINFSLNPTDELSISGALALQTVNNPTLELSFAEPCRVYVYVHHYALIQIDSNTGTITRSLDV